MKDRLVTFAVALLALIVTFAIFAPQGKNNEDVSLPSSEDSGDNGLKGLKIWLDRAAIPVFSLRKRYSELHNRELFSNSGNLLIVSLPHYREALQSEWKPLQEWVERGNGLLILGHIYSVPEWSKSENCLCDAVQLLEEMGWELTSPVPEQTEPGEEAKARVERGIEKLRSSLRESPPKATELLPLSTLAPLQSVKWLESTMLPKLLDEAWSITSDTDQLALRLFAFNAKPDRTVLWQIEAGKGSVFLSLAGDLFSNEMLNKANNAAFFKYLLSQTLSPSGQVIFDDYHFGLSDLYDPEQFFHDSRLHRSIGLILLFWFLYVLGYSNRLVPVRPATEVVSKLDSVEAMAGFFAGRLNKKELAQELTGNLLQDIRLRRRMRDEQAVWRWLERHPQISDAQTKLLKQAIERRCSQLHLLTDTITDIRIKTLS